ncbi:MAG: riboflavin biosynthesis protein RibD [Flavobacteriales bacterium]|nr:riboflavin biosynthesis protein RibD [Flavobacteriales bacterium]MBO72797.1 riboflavin biosynthesis protein RibD [Flavobacteriales bacterium]|tara:strand:+ start:321 stop:854 length:534 start_codon:yes stop_codon:yes gene_type:complete
MRKIKLYIAASLNGKIAEKDGSVDWLYVKDNDEEVDYGYEKFYESIDTTIQGSSTYKQVESWDIDFPYPEKKNYVITRNKELQDNEHVEFVSEDHINFIKRLKNKTGKDIWLIGGGQINTMLLNEGLIDELHLFCMPIVLHNGIDLFEGLPNRTDLKLIETKAHDTGTIEMKYQIIK